MDFRQPTSDDVGKGNYASDAAPINRLATELLTMVLEFAAESSNPRYAHCVSSYNRETMRTLMLVCRRFYSITQRFELQTVVLTWRSIASARIMHKDRRDRRARLYRFPLLCRHVVLTWQHDGRGVGSRWSRKLEKTRKLVQRMHNVRCFQFESESVVPMLPRIDDSAVEERCAAAWYTFENVVRGFDRLQHLVIKRAQLNDLIPACRGIGNLKTLDLTEVWESERSFVLQPEVCKLLIAHAHNC